MQFGGPRGAAGQWASCVRVIDPATASTAAVLELDENEVLEARRFANWNVLLVLVGVDAGSDLCMSFREQRCSS